MFSVDPLMRCGGSTRSAHHAASRRPHEPRLILRHYAGAAREEKTSRGKRKIFVF
jgi:hypothetical protein